MLGGVLTVRERLEDILFIGACVVVGEIGMHGDAAKLAHAINLRASKEGMLSGAVTVRYRGSDGKEKVLEKTVKTEGVAIKAEVSKNVTIDKEIIVEEENVPVWAWLVAAAGISLGVYVIARILYDKWRTEKKRKEI